MNILHLKYFVTACEYGNISVAAQALHISQSSISVAIKNLEKEFSVSLIKRQRVGFSLTDKGQEFLEMARSVIEHMESVESRMADMGQKHQEIRIGIPPMLCAIMLTDLLYKIQKNCPQIKISFIEAGSHELLKLLDNNLLDMALVPADGANTKSGIKSIKVATYEEVYCVSKKHKFAKEKEVCVKDLVNQPLVLFHESFYHNNMVKRMLEQEKTTISVAHKTTQLSTMEQLIEKNIATGIMFKERARAQQNIKGISFDPPIYTDIYLLWRKSAHLTQDMKIIISYIENMHKEKEAL